jgi:hypothetical protein
MDSLTPCRTTLPKYHQQTFVSPHIITATSSQDITAISLTPRFHFSQAYPDGRNIASVDFVDDDQTKKEVMPWAFITHGETVYTYQIMT